MTANSANWKKKWVAPRQSKQGGSPATTLHRSTPTTELIGMLYVHLLMLTKNVIYTSILTQQTKNNIYVTVRV